MTRNEILRHLEADASTQYPFLKESMRPYATPEQVGGALGHILTCSNDIRLWRLLLTLLEAE